MGKSFIKYASLIFFVLLALLLNYFAIDSDNNEARIVFFNIGQGDAILIITPENEKILIDGGPGNYLINEIGRHLPFYDKYIDVMILTHAHDDHVSGLNEILNRYEVGLILYPGDIDYKAESYLKWKELIDQRDLTLQSTIMGDIYNFSSSTLEILHPFDGYEGQKVDDVNDTSVVARYCYIEICVMLTGDIGENIEDELLASGQDLSSDILKLAHHGSHYSNTKNWFTAVDAGVVVIQSGIDNQFNHPHLRIIKRLQRLQIPIYRNDLLGEIVVVTDGQQYEVIYAESDF
jgi:competence protein ComEC